MAKVKAKRNVAPAPPRAKASKTAAAAPVVGLDIGSRWIKAVELKPSKAGPVVTAIGFEPTPPDALAEDTVLNPGALGAAIKRLFASAGMSVNKVVSAVSGTSVIVRVIEVPHMKQEELAETMKWEVERHIPFPISEVVMDFKPIIRASAAPNAPNMEVLMAVVQEQMIMKHMEALQAAKLSPAAVEVTSIALPRALLKGNPEVDEVGTVAVADIGNLETKVSIYENGVLVFPRSFPIAGQNLIRAISQSMGVEEDDAERSLRQEGMVDFSLIEALNNPPALEDEPPVLFGEADPHVATQDPFYAAQTQIPVGGPGGPVGGPFGGPVGGPFGGPEPVELDDGKVEASGFELGDDFLTPEEGGVFQKDDEPDDVLEPKVFDVDAPAEDEAVTRPGVFDLGDDDGPAAASPVFDLGSFDDQSSTSGDVDAELADYQRIVQESQEEAAEQDPLPPVLAQEPQGAEAKSSPVSEAITPVLMELAQELGRSIDYYSGRNPEPVGALIICGGIAKLPGLAAYLESTLNLKVIVGDPLLGKVNQSKRMAPEVLVEMAPAFAGCVGLALRDYVGSDA